MSAFVCSVILGGAFSGSLFNFGLSLVLQLALLLRPVSSLLFWVRGPPLLRLLPML